MNIFVTDNCPMASAQALDSRRVNKMITESVQMLATAMRFHGASDAELPITVAGKPVKATHVNHPCSTWARATRGNYDWLCAHLSALCREFEFRYGRAHHGSTQLTALERGRERIPAGAQVEFQNSSQHKELPTIQAYRETMRVKWDTGKLAATWGKRGQPEWRAP